MFLTINEAARSATGRACGAGKNVFLKGHQHRVTKSGLGRLGICNGCAEPGATGKSFPANSHKSKALCVVVATSPLLRS